jgi:Domain of unknown function (DUF4258)
MPLVDEIRRKVEVEQFEFSKHAVDQSIRRLISVQEVREAIANGEIIEEYPEDKYWPSYLITVKRLKEDRCTCNAAIQHDRWSRS